MFLFILIVIRFLLICVVLLIVIRIFIAVAAAIHGCFCIVRTRARHNQVVPNVHVAEPCSNRRAVARVFVFMFGLGVHV